jgi:ArsR family transcriptional regulator
MARGSGEDVQRRDAAEAATLCCARTDPDVLERLARVAKALSDPIRLGMLDVMTRGRSCCGVIDPQARGVPGAGDPDGICVCEFQEQFGLAQSKASYHLRVLKDAGLVTEETRGKWSFYAVDTERVNEALQALRGVVDPRAFFGPPRE